jgi:hypothetical protein
LTSVRTRATIPLRVLSPWFENVTISILQSRFTIDYIVSALMNKPAIQSDFQTDLLSMQSKLLGAIESDENERGLIDKRIEKNRALLSAINASLGAIRDQATGGRGVTGMVRTAVDSLPRSRFVAVDVEREITRLFPMVPLNKETKDRIRLTLWSMTKKNEIKAVKKGTNRRPAEYERSEHAVRTRRRAIDENLLPTNGVDDGSAG